MKDKLKTKQNSRIQQKMMRAKCWSFSPPFAFGWTGQLKIFEKNIHITASETEIYEFTIQIQNHVKVDIFHFHENDKI